MVKQMIDLFKNIYSFSAENKGLSVINTIQTHANLFSMTN